jgi:drug/metabolite transporter (DMT)-like permease
MSHTVLLLVLLAAFLHAAWNALLRSGGDRFWSVTVMSFTAALTCIPAVVLLPLPLLRAWPYVAVSGVVHIIYNLLLIRQYRQGDFGHTYPVARGSSPLLIAIGGMWFASEHLSATVFLGIILVSTGILSLAFGAKAHVDIFFAAFTTGCSIAVYSVIDALGARSAGNATAFTAWMVMGYGLTMPVVFKLARPAGQNKFWPGETRELLKAAGGGVVSVIAYGIVVWAMAHGPMGPVSALRETSALFAVVMGCVFLKEKFTVQKIVAATLIVIGNITLHLA